MIPYQDTQEANETVKKRIPYFGNIDLEALDPLHFASQRFWQVSHSLMEPQASEVWSCLDLISAGFKLCPRNQKVLESGPQLQESCSGAALTIVSLCERYSLFLGWIKHRSLLSL